MHQQRGDDLVAAARTAAHDKRVELLRQAIAVNPAHPEAHFLLGESGISASDYPEAIRHLTEATRLDPSFGPAWRQLGVAQSRHGALDAAVDSVRRAVAVEPNDAEAHSVLGGIYRRKARSHYDGTGRYDMVTLRQARDAYAEASRIDRWNTYPRMNVVRLDLQLARDDEVKRREVLDSAGKLVKLASHSAEEEGDEDKWKWFDLADALAFTGKTDEALDAARQGFLRFEDPHRSTVRQAVCLLWPDRRRGQDNPGARPAELAEDEGNRQVRRGNGDLAGVRSEVGGRPERAAVQPEAVHRLSPRRICGPLSRLRAWCHPMMSKSSWRWTEWPREMVPLRWPPMKSLDQHGSFETLASRPDEWGD